MLATRSTLQFWEHRIEHILHMVKLSDNSQIRFWSFFKWLDRQCMVLCTYLMIISQSPYTFKYCTFRLITFFKPYMSASYSIVLLVHSNWRWHAMNVLIMFGSIRMQLVPVPSFDLDPSKWRVQNWIVVSLVLSCCTCVSLFSSCAGVSKH